jgi:hypothetical protein
MTARPSMGPLRALVAVVAAVSASCAAPLMKLPSGPGAPAPDAADLLAQATSACSRIRTFTAEIVVSGSVGANKTRGRLSAGLAAPASARLEAVAPFGEPLFIFAATGNDATLLLPRDERVLEHGPPDAVLEAIAGVPLGAAELRATLTACTTGAVDPRRARQLGDLWRTVPVGPDRDVVYLHRDSASTPWRLVVSVRRAAGPQRGWRAEYRDFQNDLPRAVRLTSESAGPSGFDLRLALSQVEINVPLGPDVFRVQIPASADPITLEELRQAGPLAVPRGKTQAERSDPPLAGKPPAADVR